MRPQLPAVLALSFLTLPALAAPVSRDAATIVHGVEISPPPGAVVEIDPAAPAHWTLRGEDAQVRRLVGVPFAQAWRMTGAKLTEERVEMLGDRLVRVRYGKRGKKHVVLADLGPSAMVTGASRDRSSLALLLNAIDPTTREADTILSLGRDPFQSPL